MGGEGSSGEEQNPRDAGGGKSLQHCLARNRATCITSPALSPPSSGVKPSLAGQRLPHECRLCMCGERKAEEEAGHQTRPWARRQEWKEEPHSPGFRDVSARIFGLPPERQRGQSWSPSDVTGWGEPSPRWVCVWFVLVTTVCCSAPGQESVWDQFPYAPPTPRQGRSILQPACRRTVLIRTRESLWLLCTMRSSVYPTAQDP